MNFGKLEKTLNTVFKTGNTLQKAEAVGNIAEVHGAVTFTGIYANLPWEIKSQLNAFAREYYVALTCSAFRFAAEHLVGIDI